MSLLAYRGHFFCSQIVNLFFNCFFPAVLTSHLLQDPLNSSRNRGFAFIEYYNHACAEYSRQQMSNTKFKLGDKSPTVSWADSKNAESSAASQVLHFLFC